ncbi:MAG: biotin synthase BioB [Halobacteriovoraceae bacterium]|nr:biotin synthase BioB [Halobacteriovoraceae bacterium]
MQMLRHDWKQEEIRAIHDTPLLDLIFKAAKCHRQYFDGSTVQVSELVSVKTGGCPEDCAYCPQSARYHTDINASPTMQVAEVVDIAKTAKRQGVSRICLGAAWREVKEGRDFDNILNMVKEITSMDMEVCCTLGMLDETQATKLKEAGLYAYNHNVDTGEGYYSKIIKTREYRDRLNTLQNVRKAKIQICCGGIIGMGESIDDRMEMLETLSNLNPHPESIPINTLVAVAGTPLEKKESAEIWELLRMIATARLIMPRSFVRLSAGRMNMSTSGQALCFLSGANSIFSGDKLLTTPNPQRSSDKEMFRILGLKESKPFEEAIRNVHTQV